MTVAAWVGLEIEPAPTDEAWIFVLETIRPVARVVGAITVVAALAGYHLANRARSPWRGRVSALLTALALAGAIGPAVYLVRPHRLSPAARDIAAAVAWLRDNDLTGAPLITTNIWTSYALDSPRNLSAVPGRDLLADVEPGTVLLWDVEYAPSARFRIPADALNAGTGWCLLWSSHPRPNGTVFARVYRYQPARKPGTHSANGRIASAQLSVSSSPETGP